MANNGCGKYRAASSHDKRQSAIDQNIYRPPEPGLSDVKAALGWIPYPRMTLGLAPHPIKGAAISSSTLRMPNLTQLLNGFARGKDPNSHYATVSIQRCEGRDPSAPSEQTLGVGTYIINGAKGNGAREGQITWTLCFFTLECVAATHSLPAAAYKKLRSYYFPCPDYSRSCAMPSGDGEGGPRQQKVPPTKQQR